MDLLPVRSGYLELGGQWAPATGLVGYGEVGYRPWEQVSLFGRGEYDRSGPRVLAGARVRF